MTSLAQTAHTIRGVLLHLADVQREIKAEELDFDVSFEVVAQPTPCSTSEAFEVQALDRIAQRASWHVGGDGLSLDEMAHAATLEANELRGIIKHGGRPSARRAIALELALARMAAQSLDAHLTRVYGQPHELGTMYGVHHE